jgi:hypothetical protein
MFDRIVKLVNENKLTFVCNHTTNLKYYLILTFGGLPLVIFLFIKTSDDKELYATFKKIKS